MVVTIESAAIRLPEPLIHNPFIVGELIHCNCFVRHYPYVIFEFDNKFIIYG